MNDLVQRLRERHMYLYQNSPLASCLIEAADTIEALRQQEQGDASEIEHLKGSVEVLRRQVEELTQYGVKLDNWNDTLQEQLAAMTAERDEYLRDLAAMKNWIDDWHKKDAELDAMTKDRDMAHDLAGHCADQTAAAQADARQADEFTHKALDERDHYLQQLETAQAREQQLREALERRMRSENRWPEYVIDVLATQPDHAALDARLKEERERWADEIDAGKYGPVGAEIAATIRSLP